MFHNHPIGEHRLRIFRERQHFPNPARRGNIKRVRMEVREDPCWGCTRSTGWCTKTSFMIENPISRDNCCEQDPRGFRAQLETKKISFGGDVQILKSRYAKLFFCVQIMARIPNRLTIIFCHPNKARIKHIRVLYKILRLMTSFWGKEELDF